MGTKENDVRLSGGVFFSLLLRARKQRTAVRDKINKSQEKLAVKASPPKAHKASDISEFKEGIYVRILSMNLTGTVVGTPNTKGEVTVAVGSLTTKARLIIWKSSQTIKSQRNQSQVNHQQVRAESRCPSQHPSPLRLIF